jgi:hypothetical protein
VVVKPDLRGTVFEGGPFSILNSGGRLLADQKTPCGG